MKKNLFFTLSFCCLSIFCKNSFAQGPSVDISPNVLFDSETYKKEWHKKNREKRAKLETIDGLSDVLPFLMDGGLENLDSLSIDKLRGLSKKVALIKRKLYKKKSITALSRSMELKKLFTGISAFEYRLEELITEKMIQMIIEQINAMLGGDGD